MTRSEAEKLSATWCWAAIFAASCIVLLGALARPYELVREIWIVRATGYTALGALFLSLSTTPVLRVSRRMGWGRSDTASVLSSFRRSFGITAAAAASAHAALVTATYDREVWNAILDWPYQRAGLTALVILLLLLATSFPRLLSRLHIRLWKQLHRLSYLAAVFVFQHLMLSPFAPRGRTLAIFALLLLVGLFRFVRSRPATDR